MSINPGTTPGYMPPSQQPSYAPPPAQHTVYAPPGTVYAPPAPASSNKIPILFGAVIALLAAVIYLFVQVNNLHTEVAKNQNDLLADLDKVREATSVTSQTNRRTVEALSAQLETARRQANMAAGQAKTEALRKVDETRAELEAAQKRQADQVNTQFSEVKQAQDSTNSKIGEVNTEVSNVKTDLGSTKSELEKTVAQLKTVSGDVDGHSTMIATNGKELAALRALGERNFFEFNMHKAKTAQKVGDVSLRLEKADPKHNRYTIELTVDDKTVQKKDRTINEPLQFLTSKAKQPYEIVVNDVKKDQISGYLSVPKVLNGR
jgi:chromosome segregation ATPase